jgi:cysteinyl-tRNA synthetase
MVRFEGGKMRKSLGNLVHVSQALQRAPAAAVRLYLASHRYGRDWDFSWSGLARAARLVERARALLAESARGAGELPAAVVVVGAGPAVRAPRGAGKALVKEFNAALQDDLDTPSAIRALRRATRERDAAATRWMLGILVGSASLT